ncbi:MAG: sigma-70 family RNA polymerase sigma factor [Chloroflexi bacterium]|nr:sigma-70 family RNA polymerase sigma factor [Chloroflexota bacterium]MCC6894257.1 sigma-70 family RNA polymerase sigma factor [Anaerolineae bacterium]
MASELQNEPALIKAAVRGNMTAFNDLVLHYQDRVYSIAYRILGESESAADAAQDAFIAAYRRLDTYRGGSFRAWLFRIATNACYDELRRLKRRPVTAIEDLPGADADDGPPLAADSATPEQAAQQAELARAIEQCIGGLQTDQKAVLVLSDVEGLSYQEITEITGATLGTVKSRLSRARAGVRNCLGNVRELLPSVYRL